MASEIGGGEARKEEGGERGKEKSAKSRETRVRCMAERRDGIRGSADAPRPLSGAGRVGSGGEEKRGSSAGRGKGRVSCKCNGVIQYTPDYPSQSISALPADRERAVGERESLSSLPLFPLTLLSLDLLGLLETEKERRGSSLVRAVCLPVSSSRLLTQFFFLRPVQLPSTL